MPTPTTLLMPRGTWGQPYRIGLVWELMAPTTLLAFCHAREVVGYCPTGVQGMVLGIAVGLSALPYFLRPFSGPYRAGVPGRLVLVGCASWRGAVSRGSMHPRSEKRVEVRSGVWLGLLVGEAIWRRARVGSERCSSSGRRGGPESEAGIVPPRSNLPVGDWIALSACRLGFWADLGVACRLQCCLLN